MTGDFAVVLARLRCLMLEAAPGMVAAKDAPGSLELRSPEVDPRSRQPGWFGTVTLKKSYVAYHLMPLYVRRSWRTASRRSCPGAGRARPASTSPASTKPCSPSLAD